MSIKNILNPKVIVTLWMAGFVGSFIFQTVLQSWFAQNSHWGSNVGWQNEIAIWNAGVFFILLGVILSKAGIERYVLFGLFVLSLCFGINHGIALLSSPSSISNWLGMSFNAIGVSMYLLFLVNLTMAH